MDDRAADRAVSALERYRDGPPKHPRSYPDLHEHVLALAQAERSPVVPNVPTTTEAGLPQLQASGWNAMFAPKGTPKAIVDRLADAAAKAFDDPATRKRLEDIGAVIPPPDRRGSQALRGFVAAEVAKWTPVLKAANASAN